MKNASDSQQTRGDGGYDLIAWYGLPGSGKSWYLERYRRTHSVFDDFMKHSIRDRCEFAFSRHYPTIANALKCSQPCVIADVRLCHQMFRGEVKDVLRELLGYISITWHCFDCRTAESVDICRDNVRYRAETTGRPPEHALKTIDELAPHYSIADSAIVYQVIRARAISSAVELTTQLPSLN
jgi:hypothetical protein